MPEIVAESLIMDAFDCSVEERTTGIRSFFVFGAETVSTLGVSDMGNTFSCFNLDDFEYSFIFGCRLRGCCKGLEETGLDDFSCTFTNAGSVR